MSNPAVGAKYVAAVVVGLVGAGAFAGVSHDGRGGAPSEDPASLIDAPAPTVEGPITTLVVPPTNTLVVPTTNTLVVPPTNTLVVPPTNTLVVPPTTAALPAPPDPVPTRARVRTRGS